MTMRQQIDPVPMPRLPRTKHQTKSCPFCAETIRYGAIKCRFCGEFLDGSRRLAQGAKPKAQDQEHRRDDRDPTENTGASAGESQPDGEGEDGTPVLWFGRPSLLALTGMFIKTGCFLAVCWAVYQYRVMALVQYLPRTNVRPEQLVQIEGWLDAGVLALALLAAMTLAWKAIALKSTGYEVTPDRIEWSRGVFDRHVDNIDMFRVVDLKLRQSLLECLLGIGTVIALTSDESDPEFEFTKVSRCRHLYEALKEAGLNADKRRNVIHVE
ncbi:MAG: PH domain-containing protein [Planctomycetes bacterium]|nr:PH domain-containing protein [Planctomycetota bacterium]